jgi:hypothetical protein
VTLIDTATRVLHAMAASDLDTVRTLCDPDVVVYGTDEDERWTGIEPLVGALAGMRDLRLSATWTGEPAAGPSWVAGVARYLGESIGELLVRVTMVFDDGRLAHGHFSVEAASV